VEARRRKWLKARVKRTAARKAKDKAWLAARERKRAKEVAEWIKELTELAQESAALQEHVQPRSRTTLKVSGLPTPNVCGVGESRAGKSSGAFAGRKSYKPRCINSTGASGTTLMLLLLLTIQQGCSLTEWVTSVDSTAQLSMYTAGMLILIWSIWGGIHWNSQPQESNQKAGQTEINGRYSWAHALWLSGICVWRATGAAGMTSTPAETAGELLEWLWQSQHWELIGTVIASLFGSVCT
jgi:hypothetical protein